MLILLFVSEEISNLLLFVTALTAVPVLRLSPKLILLTFEISFTLILLSFLTLSGE